jgi:hypothetical protein
MFGRGFDSRQLHPEPHSNECGLFFTPPTAQVYSAFPPLNGTQACIYCANVKLLLRNTLDFNTYNGCNIFATAPRNVKKTGNKIRFFLYLFLLHIILV